MTRSDIVAAVHGPAGARGPGRRAHRGTWLLACATGEALGIGLVSVVYAAIDRGMLAAAAPAILAAGAFEGLCLGGMQAHVLRRFGVPVLRYTMATILAAGIGYALSLAAGAGTGAGGDAAAAEPSVPLIVLLGAAMGAGLGPIMGLIQAWGAAGRLGYGRWTLANLVGWVVAMAIILSAASLVPAGLSLGAVGATGLLAGALAGLAIGTATFFALPDRPERPTEEPNR